MNYNGKGYQISQADIKDLVYAVFPSGWVFHVSQLKNYFSSGVETPASEMTRGLDGHGIWVPLK